MKTRELITALQKLVEVNPEAAGASICVSWESDTCRGLERDVRGARFRLTNGTMPEIVLET
jgi:hypothetical protein